MTHNADVERMRRELRLLRLQAFLDAAGWFVVGFAAWGLLVLLGEAAMAGRLW